MMLVTLYWLKTFSIGPYDHSGKKKIIWTQKKWRFIRFLLFFITFRFSLHHFFAPNYVLLIWALFKRADALIHCFIILVHINHYFWFILSVQIRNILLFDSFLPIVFFRSYHSDSISIIISLLMAGISQFIIINVFI